MMQGAEHCFPVGDIDSRCSYHTDLRVCSADGQALGTSKQQPMVELLASIGRHAGEVGDRL
jgi:hypothetical protein